MRRLILFFLFAGFSLISLQGQIFTELTNLNPDINQLVIDDSEIDLIFMKYGDYEEENNQVLLFNLNTGISKKIDLDLTTQLFFNSYYYSYFDPILNYNVIYSKKNFDDNTWYRFSLGRNNEILINPFFESSYPSHECTPFYFNKNSPIELNLDNIQTPFYRLEASNDGTIQVLMKSEDSSSVYAHFYPIWDDQLLIIEGRFVGGNDGVSDYSVSIRNYITNELMQNSQESIIGLGSNCIITTPPSNIGFSILNSEKKIIYHEDYFDFCSPWSSNYEDIEFGSFEKLIFFSSRILVYEFYDMFSSYSEIITVILDLKTSKIYITQDPDLEFIGFRKL